MSSAPRTRWRAECLKINDLILTTYADFGFDQIVVKLSTRPREARRHPMPCGITPRPVMEDVLEADRGAIGGGRIRTEINPGEGAFYGPKFRIRPARCDRARLAMRHDARSISNLARAFRCVLCRCRRPEEDPGDDPPRHLRARWSALAGILIEHFAGHFPLLARAGAGGRVHHPTSEADGLCRGG